MKEMHQTLLLVLITSLLFACKTTQTTDCNSIVISMQKTRCFGSCPVYTLEIYENGQVAFHGEENVDMIGDFAASLSKEEYNTLIESFRDSNFFDFEESYTSTVSDLPTTFLLYKEGDKSLRITDYYGAPDKLKQLEKLVEDLVGTLKWKKSIAP